MFQFLLSEVEGGIKLLAAEEYSEVLIGNDRSTRVRHDANRSKNP